MLYEELAADYDLMTGFGARLQTARRLVGSVLARLPALPEAALDVACGTGVYTLALAAAGVRAVGADLSAAMLEQAAANAKRLGLSAAWLETGMEDLDAAIHGQQQFGLILCMGNSLPHLHDEAALGKACDAFRRRLAPGGLLVLQVLNYARILAEGERIVEVNREGSLEFVRFYDFLENGRLRFNVLRLDWTDPAAPAHRLEHTELRPWLFPELRAALAAAGFRRINAHGTPALDDAFAAATSPGLFILAD